MPRPKHRTQPLAPSKQRKHDQRMANKVQLERDCNALVAAYCGSTTEYSEELGLLLAEMVVQGTILDEIAALPNMPKIGTLCRWIAQEDHPFCKLYYGAKQALVPLHEERALRAGTKPLIGKRITTRYINVDGELEEVTETVEYDNVERAKLEMSAHQWTLSHLAPRKHGRKDVSDESENANGLKSLTDEMRRRNDAINGG